MTEYFRGGGYSSGFLTRGGMPVTMCRLNLVKGLGPVLQIAEGWTVDLPDECARTAERAHQPHLADPLVRAQPDRPGRLPGCLQRDGQLGRQPWSAQLRPHRRRPDQPGFDPAHPGEHA